MHGVEFAINIIGIFNRETPAQPHKSFRDTHPLFASISGPTAKILEESGVSDKGRGIIKIHETANKSLVIDYEHRTIHSLT